MIPVPSNTSGSLLNLTLNDLRYEFGNQLGQGAACSFSLDDLNYLLADFPDLECLGVGGLGGTRRGS